MSESSSLFIVTTDKDVFKITSVVKEVLSDLISKEIQSIIADKGNACLNEIFNRKDNRLPNFNVEPFGTVYCSFIYKTEVRRLQICFYCDCDYSDIYEGSKVIFSLGYWGQAELYLTLLRDKFVELEYTTYYNPNSSNDENNWQRQLNDTI